MLNHVTKVYQNCNRNQQKKFFTYFLLDSVTGFCCQLISRSIFRLVLLECCTELATWQASGRGWLLGALLVRQVDTNPVWTAVVCGSASKLTSCAKERDGDVLLRTRLCSSLAACLLGQSQLGSDLTWIMSKASPGLPAEYCAEVC